MIHQMFFKIKSYEANELFRINESEILVNQVISENEYLRYICDNVIKTDIINSKKDQELIEQHKKEISIIPNRNLTESNLLEIDDIDKNSKGLHKRQKTHINILTSENNSINTSVEGNFYNDTIGSNSNITIAEIEKVKFNLNKKKSKDGKADLFGMTINDFSKEKKIKRIRINTEDEKEKNNQNTKDNEIIQGNGTGNGSTKNSTKQVYLFYRTPKNNQNKIDFSSANFSQNK